MTEAVVSSEATQARPDAKVLASFAALEVALGFTVASAWRFFPASQALVSWGAFAALLGGLVTLAGVHLGLRRGGGVNGLFAAISVGFLLRTLLLGLGFVASGAKTAPFQFVIPFFLVFAATQVAEIVYVVLHNSKAQGQSAKGRTASQ